MADERNRRPSYDPLAEIINHFATRKKRQSPARAEARTVEERLKQRIIDGEKKDLEKDLQHALGQYTALDIINTLLLDGMKVVGELFGKGEMQLPFVLQSAEVMKAAVAYLEPHMEKIGGSQKGTIVLATVKGDVHDIGKNLVDIILSNNGYKVVNLGIKVPVDTILHAAEEHGAHAIGMSGLLVKSTLIMKENLEIMVERGRTWPVLLGGAALTRRYVEEDLRRVYGEPLFYCEDAFAGLRSMEALRTGSVQSAPPADRLSEPTNVIGEIVKRIRIVRHQWNKALEYTGDYDFRAEEVFGGESVHDTVVRLIAWERSLVERLEFVQTGRFDDMPTYDDAQAEEWNRDFIETNRDLSREELTDTWNASQAVVIKAIEALPPDRLALRRGNSTVADIIADSTYIRANRRLREFQEWLRKRQVAPTRVPAVPLRSNVQRDHPIPVRPFYGSRVVDSIALDDIYPYINEIALFRGQWQFTRGSMQPGEYETFTDRTVRPIFERWKERAVADALLQPGVVYGYFPCQSDGNDLIVYAEDERTEHLRFTFPRQSRAPFYCISDFFASLSSGRMDVLGCMLVTVGRRASEFAARLFADNNYTDYLYFHGLSVEAAEALAEYWHRTIRAELQVSAEDSPDIRRLFQQQYRGSRYSFGYPACPNLEDQKKLFTLLEPGRIGVSLTEEFHLEPEQSTSAIVVHHPQAKYFNV